MASSTSCSGGNAPVDSTETKTDSYQFFSKIELDYKRRLIEKKNNYIIIEIIV